MKIFIDDIGKCSHTFNTIHKGFPNVHDKDIVVISDTRKSHHQVISELIEQEQVPFWLVDTDVMFYEPMPFPPADVAIFGEYEPPFNCPISHKQTQARLSPACMYIDPRRFMLEWTRATCQVPVPWYMPLAHPVNPIVIGDMFWDVMAVAYRTVSSTRFAPTQLNSFVHLHCGSWLDVAKQHIPGLAEIHANPPRTQEAGMRLREMQAEFYRRQATPCE